MEIDPYLVMWIGNALLEWKVVITVESWKEAMRHTSRPADRIRKTQASTGQGLSQGSFR